MTLGLAAIAVMVHAIVVANGRIDGTSIAWAAGLVIAMVLAAVVLRRLAQRNSDVMATSPLLVAAAAGALIWEWVARAAFEAGQPFEIVTMTVVRNLVLGLGAVSVWSENQRLAVVLSLFLTLFGLTASHDLAAQGLAAGFALGAIGWLIISHWENVRRRLRGREAVRWPRLAVLLPMVLLLVAVAAWSGTDRRVASALRGFLPSSGGTGGNDPHARDGVGDGEMLVAGTDRIQSFAPLEDAPFMQDDQPSLYDLFDDTYENEIRTQRTDRAISLPPDLARRTREHIHNQTEKPSRQFSTVRQPRDPGKTRPVESIRSDALFYVAGRVPLHLRQQVYDLYDGETWYPEEPAGARPRLEIHVSHGKPWLRLPDRSGAQDYLGPAETHALKIVRFDSNVIPAPLYLHGVHIDLVDRADLFQHGPDGLIALDRESLPSLVPIHIASRAVRTRDLIRQRTAFLQYVTEQATFVIPSHIDADELRRRATEWCDEAPLSRGNEPSAAASASKVRRTEPDRAPPRRRVTSDWERISAVTRSLQQSFQLDPDWRPPADARSGVEAFLEAGRGPDYQFATAAALLLRSLGYSTRVVSGFYVHPRHYDPHLRHTPVFASDVHFWAEVRVSGGDWITVESTPGYEVLEPPPGLWESFWQTIREFSRHSGGYSVALCFAAAALVWQRRQVRSVLATARWKWLWWWAPEVTLVSTIELLQTRAELAGCPRNRTWTYHSWLQTLISRADSAELVGRLSELRREIDAAAYSPVRGPLPPATRARCRAVVQACTVAWFRGSSLARASGCTRSNPHSEPRGQAC